MFQVGRDDARIVGPIPGTCGRISDEGHPQLDRVRGRIPAQSAAARHRFAAIPKQSLVHPTPPWTPRRRRIHRRQHAPAELPAHERHGRAAEWQVLRCPAERTVVRPGDQFEPSGRVVAYRLDLIQGPRRSGAVPEVHLPIVGHLVRLARIGEAELAW